MVFDIKERIAIGIGRFSILHTCDTISYIEYIYEQEG